MLITSTVSDNAMEDAWIYSWCTAYSSVRFYKHYLKDVVEDEAFKWIWKSKCSIKINVFSWLLLADRVNTQTFYKEEITTLGVM